MSEGKIQWYDVNKGYGFVATADGRPVFIHCTSFSKDCPRELSEGDQVWFDIVDGEKGPRTENVTINGFK